MAATPTRRNLLARIAEYKLSHMGEDGYAGPADAAGLPRLKLFVSVVAFAMSAYHLWTGWTGEPIPEIHRPVHLLFALSILFLDRGRTAATPAGRAAMLVWDLVMVALLVASTGYLFLNADYVSTRLMGVTPLSWLEQALGIGLLLVLMEAARRTVGWALIWLTFLLIAYALFGNWLPPPFWHRGFDVEAVIDMLYFTNEGLWGTPLGVTASYIFHFVLFGALLVASGAGTFFTNVADALTGRYVGGPAKTAVVSSALMAMLSGSAAANVVTTGSFTIPTMKRAGYHPEYAAGVEATASSGGVLTPPVMGAAAFVMAEFLGVSYVEVCIAAALPALLYYVAIFTSVDLEARRLGLRPLAGEDIPRLWPALRRHGYLLLSVIALIWFLIEGYTPVRGAIWAIISLTAMLILLDPPARRRILPILWQAMTEAPRMMAPIAVAVGIGGIIVGIIAMTGIGVRLSSVILNVADNVLLIILFLTMIFSIILGMGMPVTGAYIILAVLLAPAMVKLGTPAMAAHMFIFWGGCKSNITPPVAIASYAAAAIAGTDPWRTSLTAFRIGLSVFIIPFMFIYSPELLLIGEPGAIAWRAAMAAGGVAMLSVACMGWLFVSLHWSERLVAFAAASFFIFPELIYDLMGIALSLLFLGWCRLRRTKRAETAAAAAGD